MTNSPADLPVHVHFLSTTNTSALVNDRPETRERSRMPLSPADITEIQLLYSAYCHLIDDGDAAAFANLFVPEGVLTSGGHPLVGTASLEKFATSVPLRTPGIRHVMVNIHVDGDGDHADGRAYLLAYTGSSEGPVMRATGCYRDSLQRVGGSWKFVKRDFTMDR